MAQVPYGEGVPSVSPQTTVPSDYQNIPTRPGEFGAHIAQGEQQAGAGATKAATFFGEVAADQATNNWQDQTSDILEKYRSLQGEDRVRAWPRVRQQLQEALAAHRDSLGTAGSQLDFDQQTRRIHYYQLAEGGRLYDEAQKIWAQDVNKSTIKGALQGIAANPDDEANFNARIGDAMRGAFRDLHLSGFANDNTIVDQTQHDIRAQATMARIHAWEATDPGKANAYLSDPANRALVAGLPGYDALSARLQNQADKQAGHSAAISAWTGSSDLWSRIKQQEHGIGAGGVALVSPKGAVGVSQILPSTAQQMASDLGVPYDENRLHTDQAYNERLGQEYLQQQLTRYGGNPALASAAYNAGPERVDEWISRFGDPRTDAISNADFASKIPIAETRNYVRAVALSPAATPVGGRGFPTREELIGRIPEGLSDVAYGHAYSEVNRLYNHLEQATSATRAVTRQSIRNGIPMLEDGRDFAYSESQIRSVLPGPEADQALDLLADAKAVGQQKIAVRGMSMNEALNQSAANRAALANAPPAEYTKMKKMADAFEVAATQHFKELFADPAGYIASTNPEIERLRQASHAETAEAGGALRAAGQPTAFEKYAAALTDEETRLGVPSESQHILSTNTAPGIAQDIMADPSQAPKKIHDLQQGYGAAWPAVWSDLATLGKMPTGYQALGVLDEANAEQLARGLGAGKEGKAWDTLIGASTKNDISKAVRGDDGVQRLLTSLRTEGASPGQIADFLGTINTLGYTKQMEGDTSAAANAAKAFTDLYQFMPNGGARVPTKQFDAVSANARATLDGLRADNLTIPPGFNSGRPGMPTPDDYVRLVQSVPSWVNAQGDALVLMSGSPLSRIVRDKEGNPISVKFGTPPPAQSASPLTAPPFSGP